MLNLPPPPPPYSIVRQAEPAIVRALQQHARREADPKRMPDRYRSAQDRIERTRRERQQREMIAILRNRTTTSQRY
jgi:hypothetical protein